MLKHPLETISAEIQAFDHGLPSGSSCPMIGKSLGVPKKDQLDLLS